MQSPKIHDVTLIIDKVEQTDKTQLVTFTIIDIILHFRPTQLIKIRETSISKVLSPERATSRTLVIYVYAARTPPRQYKQREISINTWNVSYTTETPKLLVVTILEQEEATFDRFLYFLWRSRILNSAVLEVTHCREPRNPCLIVHRYNPFSEHYTKEPYSKEIDFFPDKLRNMHGHPFYLTQSKQYPPLVIKRNPDDPTRIRIQGTAAGYIIALSIAMNATLILNEKAAIYGSYQYGYPKVYTSEHEQFELDLYSLLVVLTNYPNNAVISVPIMTERTCFCVPLIFETPTISPWNIFITVLVGSLAISVIRLFLASLKINWRLGSAMNVVRLMLGIGIEDELKTFTEKVLFLWLVIATTRYSSIFYTELFDLGVITDQELRIRNMKDLEDSGLRVFLGDDLYVYLSDMEIPDKVRSRMTIHNKSEFAKNLARMDTYRSQAGLISENLCQILSVKSFTLNKTIMKVSDFCPGMQPMALPLAWRSPYRDRVNDVFLRVQESSLANWQALRFTTVLNVIAARQRFHDKENVKSVIPEDRVLKLVFLGYLVSFFIFIGEVLVQRSRFGKRGGCDRFKRSI